MTDYECQVIKHGTFNKQYQRNSVLNFHKSVLICRGKKERTFDLSTMKIKSLPIICENNYSLKVEIKSDKSKQFREFLIIAS